MLNTIIPLADAPTSSDVLLLDTEGKLDLTVQDFIGQRVAFLGSSGTGKTNSVALILEKVLPFMPMVIFDQHDEFWGLCEQYEMLRVGKSPESQIKVGVDQAAQIAELSHSKRLSVLVEMLHMTRAERLEFVHLYCAKIWELNKIQKQPYGVVLEEAQNFIPEGKSSSPAQEMMKQFALEGRKFGFSIFISTQRSAEVSKTILGQCRVAFLHGVDIYPDVQSYAGMLPFTLAETKKIALNLGTGECIVKIKRDGPAQFVHPVKMLRRETFHVGDTPTLDDEAPPLRAIDGDLLLELQQLLAPKVDKKAAIVSDVLPLIEFNDFFDKHVDSYIDDLRRQLDQAEKEVERMKRQPVAVRQELPLLAAKNSSKIDFSPEKPRAIIDTHNTAQPVDEWDGRTELAATRAKNRQKREFDSLILTIKDAQIMHRRTLVYLTQREGIVFKELDLIRNIGYSRGVFQDHRPVSLINRGLIQRKIVQGKYTYESTVRQYVTTNFPDLDEDELVQVICKLEKV
jgi:hypothetical protein